PGCAHSVRFTAASRLIRAMLAEDGPHERKQTNQKKHLQKAKMKNTLIVAFAVLALVTTTAFADETHISTKFQGAKANTGTVTHTVKDGKKDRKSTRLNSSHVSISYAVFCLKKKTKLTTISTFQSPP